MAEGSNKEGNNAKQAKENQSIPDFKMDELIYELGLKDLTIIKARREVKNYAQANARLQGEIQKLQAELAKK